MNISVREYFHNVYISDGVEIDLSSHGLGNIYLFSCVIAGQRCNQSSSNIHDSTFDTSS